MTANLWSNVVFIRFAEMPMFIVCSQVLGLSEENSRQRKFMTEKKRYLTRSTLFFVLGGCVFVGYGGLFVSFTPKKPLSCIFKGFLASFAAKTPFYNRSVFPCFSLLFPFKLLFFFICFFFIKPFRKTSFLFLSQFLFIICLFLLAICFILSKVVS